MNTQEKTLARQLFQNKILKADGQTFEDLFSFIMNYAEPDFQSIKPWGNIGDRKNDGYIASKGVFFQVYSPEDIRKSYTDTVNKLESDFVGLKNQWQNIKEFYFVVNDKFKGVNPDCEIAIRKIKDDYSLDESKFLTAKDLENKLFELDDDKVYNICGNIPDPANIKVLDFSILKEVVDYIMSLPLEKNEAPILKLPNWDDKMKFNNLSDQINALLINGSLQVHALEKYLSNNGTFLADNLRDKMNEIYISNKLHSEGDELFWAILNEACPKAKYYYQTSVIVIMSKFFESCDIFEEPES